MKDCTRYNVYITDFITFNICNVYLEQIKNNYLFIYLFIYLSIYSQSESKTNDAGENIQQHKVNTIVRKTMRVGLNSLY